MPTRNERRPNVAQPQSWRRAFLRIGSAPAAKNAAVRSCSRGEYFRLAQSLLAGDCEVCIIVASLPWRNGATPQSVAPERGTGTQTRVPADDRSLRAGRVPAASGHTEVLSSERNFDIGARIMTARSFRMGNRLHVCRNREECRMRISLITQSAFAVGLLVALPVVASANEELLKMQENSKDWVMPNGNYSSTRYSELKQITAENVKHLQPVWTFSTGVLRGHEGGPLVIGDVMYIHTPFPN